MLTSAATAATASSTKSIVTAVAITIATILLSRVGSLILAHLQDIQSNEQLRDKVVDGMSGGLEDQDTRGVKTVTTVGE
ncbi:hypothetical protein Q9L58_005626 [Maublancomyces gigas]|uniref:Uncharacterized protein n=1 Tax=Discina gigas TaxID=1032678 RepID=A0ABR3GHU2_9PEZI